MSDVSASDACKQAGVTYRQFDYWVRRGWIKAEQDGFGSGRPRAVPWREVKILRMMGQLTAAGLEPEAAHAAAREIDRAGYARLGADGYRLVLDAQGAPPDGERVCDGG